MNAGDERGHDGRATLQRLRGEQPGSVRPGTEHVVAVSREAEVGLDGTGAVLDEDVSCAQPRERRAQPRSAHARASRPARVADEHEVLAHVRHRAKERAVRRKERDVVTCDRRHQRQRIVGARVIRDHQHRARRGDVAFHVDARAERAHHRGRRRPQPVRGHVCIEARERLAETTARHARQRPHDPSQHRRRGASARGIDDLRHRKRGELERDRSFVAGHRARSVALKPSEKLLCAPCSWSSSRTSGDLRIALTSSRNGMDLLAHMLSEWRVTALPVVLDLLLWIAPFCGVAHGPVPV